MQFLQHNAIINIDEYKESNEVWEEDVEAAQQFQYGSVPESK